MRRQASQTSQDLDAEGWCEIQIVPEDGPDATQDEGKQQHVGSETPVSRNPRLVAGPEIKFWHLIYNPKFSSRF